MTQPLRIESFRTRASSRAEEGLVAGFHALTPSTPAGAAAAPPADAMLLLACRGDRPVARLSYRLARGLRGAPERTGVVGHYEAEEDEAGVALLERAAVALAEKGAGRVVGPMDSTTWGRYRLALPSPDGGGPPPFLTEPVNPPGYPSHFEAAGFRPVEEYLSRLVPVDALADRTRELADRLSAEGYALDPLDPDLFDTLLDELYDLSIAAFADNPYYSPIDRPTFRATYQPVRAFLDPELVVLARDAEARLVGFVFAFPDLLDPAREADPAADGRPTRVIVKTLAVAKRARGAGLGSMLVHEAHRRAAERGYRSAIHALMHVENASHRISRHGGDVYRRYALFGREP